VDGSHLENRNYDSLMIWWSDSLGYLTVTCILKTKYHKIYKGKNVKLSL
jgi:hypothetical protein